MKCEIFSHKWGWIDYEYPQIIKMFFQCTLAATFMETGGDCVRLLCVAIGKKSLITWNFL